MSFTTFKPGHFGDTPDLLNLQAKTLPFSILTELSFFILFELLRLLFGVCSNSFFLDVPVLVSLSIPIKVYRFSCIIFNTSLFTISLIHIVMPNRIAIMQQKSFLGEESMLSGCKRVTNQLYSSLFM